MEELQDLIAKEDRKEAAKAAKKSAATKDSDSPKKNKK